MVDGRLPSGNALRLAVIDSVDKTKIWCRYLGPNGEDAFECPIPQPYIGKGSGILAGVERESVVLIAEGFAESRFVVAFIPIRSGYFDQEGIDDVELTQRPFPEIEEGELMFTAGGSSYIDIRDGDIVLEAGAGQHDYDFELCGDDDSKALFLRVENKYSFTEASRSIEGIVKRDKSIEEDEMDTETFDFLTGEGYNELLEIIGRVPKYNVHHATEAVQNYIRNPALVEKRNIVYEYAESFDVGKLTDEVRLMEATKDEDEVEGRQLGLRQDRRTDVLNLNMLNYNHLVEKVEGTLVDIYGNVLDINRNIIDIPDYEVLGVSEDLQAAVKTMYNYMRRSVKYHFEINSRKDIPSDEPARGKDTIEQREHSRWSIDVDGEGLTKVNIPRSSDTGNIPVLGRYITSRNDENKEDGSFRDGKDKDIRISAFGVNGPTISNSAYVPETIDESAVTAGTAYHDLMATAGVLFDSGKWGKITSNDEDEESDDGEESPIPTDRMTTIVTNKIDDEEANAGGRSLHANLDGSAEISIGADTVDSKSLLLDLEGGVISHYGKDINGRSIIHQSDGTVLIQIGSKDGNKGRLEIHLANGVDADGEGKSQKIIIDEDGMTIDVDGNMILNASGNIGINAEAHLVLNGTRISFHGSVDPDPEGERDINTGSTTLNPGGRGIHCSA